MTKDIRKYMEGCNMYQKIKNRIEILIEKSKLSKVLEKLQTHLIVDFIMKLLLVAGKNTILAVYNKLFKIIYFVTTKKTLAKGLAQLFRDNVQKLHELLESIVLNKGLQFAAKITKELNNILEIKIKLLTLLHSQTDRQIEHMNQELE